MSSLKNKVSAAAIAGTAITLLSMIVGIVTLICYGITAADGMGSPWVVYLLIVIAMVLQCINIGYKLRGKYEAYQVQDALTYVALILYLVCLPIFVWAREAQISLILNSTVTAPITVTWILSAAGMVVAGLLQVVASFIKDNRAKAA